MRLNPEERLPEWRELEIREYIDAFKASSDRTRYVIYINAVVSLLILICTWNTTEFSWSRRRLAMAEHDLRQSYERMYSEGVRVRAIPAATTVATKNINEVADRKRFVDEHMRTDRAIAYRDTALPRIWFVPIPGLGANVHVNDLGLLGGVMMLVLSGLLCLSMVRQHENLYLALFKVRRLCEFERLTRHDGESMSNFLYHSLAMGQVLNYPPTLARWGHGVRNRLAGTARWIIVCLPLIVQAFVVIYNSLTLSIAHEAWGAIANFRMAAQVVLFVGILCACALSGIYSSACNYRWRATFNLINPGLSHVEPRPWLDWVRLRRSHDIGPPFLLAELTYSFQPTPIPAQVSKCVAKATLKLKTSSPPRITQGELVAMATKLQDNAKQQIGEHNLKRAESWEAIISSMAEGDWAVEAVCTYRTT
jgi:hypothetical protein